MQLELRAGAMVIASNDDMNVRNLRILTLQTASTTDPILALNSLTVSNGTLRSEYNGLISADVFVGNLGIIDLGWTLESGTLRIDGMSFPFSLNNKLLILW